VTVDSDPSLLLGPFKVTSGIRVLFLQYKADVYEPEEIQDRGKQCGEVAAGSYKL